MDFKRLLDYDLWANQKIFGAFQSMNEGEIKSEIEHMFSHILAAQIIWAERIESKKPTMGVWPEMSLIEMEQLMSANHKKLTELISKREERFSYKNSKGATHEGKAEDILMHLIIHGQHHRAQIAKMMREEGITPPGTDFLFYEDNRQLIRLFISFNA